MTKQKLDLKSNKYLVRDLHAHKNLGTTGNNLISTIPPHDILMVKLTKTP
jgi:hypothetical protein